MRLRHDVRERRVRQSLLGLADTVRLFIVLREHRSLRSRHVSPARLKNALKSHARVARRSAEPDRTEGRRVASAAEFQGPDHPGSDARRCRSVLLRRDALAVWCSCASRLQISIRSRRSNAQAGNGRATTTTFPSGSAQYAASSPHGRAARGLNHRAPHASRRAIASSRSST